MTPKFASKELREIALNAFIVKAQRKTNKAINIAAEELSKPLLIGDSITLSFEVTVTLNKELDS